ncbi:MAG: D-alanyl-D-alanine carboxypeptidase [Nitrospirota bacterium]|nr:D-alanyl-D-alanine carboxypeptidase [Nitrospirota bacterium]
MIQSINRFFSLSVLAGAAALLLATTPAHAAPKAVSAVVVMDAVTGQVVESMEPDKKIGPASLNKMMTLYLLYSSVRDGLAAWDDTVRVSRNAWNPEGSKMFLREGEQVTLRELAVGIAVASGNDACIAVAEHLAGTEPEFVKWMNETGQKLGMTATTFGTATGLPARNQWTTAHDMAVLGRALITDFPDSIAVVSTREMKHDGIAQNNRNLLLWRDMGVDGIKTGHTEGSGYHLVSTAKKGDQRFVVVVMGARTEQARANLSQRYLLSAFQRYATVSPVTPGEPMGEARVWKGMGEQVTVVAKDKTWLTVRRDDVDKLTVETEMRELEAPVAAGQPVGMARVKLGDQVLGEVELVAAEDMAQGGVVSRLLDSVILGSHDFLDKLF